MSIPIPADVAEVLRQPVFVHLATVGADGGPHVSAMWMDVEGDRIVFSTAEGRAKLRNLRRDPRVALSLTVPGTPYHNIVIWGRAVVIEPRGFGLIDHLAHKYTGSDRYEWAPEGQVRVDIEVEIDRISS
ncbi:MAG: PPOX class F420-dependent oxidoreductase [Acidimicrobiia bacterium]|jgi:PPOX class probable F420-dependent enzyme